MRKLELLQKKFSVVYELFSHTMEQVMSRQGEKSSSINEYISERLLFYYRYQKYLRSAKISGIRKGGLNGVLMGIIWFFVFCVYALVCKFSLSMLE